MNIYVAGSWSRRREIVAVVRRLEQDGHHITSSWLTAEEPTPWDPQDPYSLPTDTIAMIAQRDLHDVATSEAVVLIANEAGVKMGGGGRHWECGYAYALGIPIIVVGRHEHVFHYLPRIVVTPDLDGMVMELRHLEGIKGQ